MRVARAADGAEEGGWERRILDWSGGMVRMAAARGGG